MNHFTKLIIEFANQRNYLDELFRVYPTIPEDIREIDERVWKRVVEAYNKGEMEKLINILLSLDLFPIKDSYVAYLRRDPSAIERNPRTVQRLYGRLREMGLDKIWDRVTEPKETNRQIGPMFKRWVQKGVLGASIHSIDAFPSSTGDAILDATDAQMMIFAQEHLNYTGEKGLDFIARFNNKYVAGEAKFLTDFGGHQNAQFNDAMALLENRDIKAVTIAILDGVLYIKGRNKMHRAITKNPNYNIMSALVLREFLYQL
ncbi:MAG: restriction endonuclease [Clostridium sp.]|nr:restriction endonuclease [Clostridium sp.]